MNGILHVGWISMFWAFQGAGEPGGSQSQLDNEALVRQAEQVIRKEYWGSVEKLGFERFLTGRDFKTKALAYDAIRGLVGLLKDPTTRLLTPEQVDALIADLTSEGTATLGLTQVLRLDVDLRSHAITVISPVPGSPAAAADLRPGDVVEAVDGVSTNGMPLHEVTGLLRRGDNDRVVLRIKRRHSRFQVKLDRKMKWTAPAGASHRKIDTKGGPAGLLAITSFTGNAADETRAAAEKFKEWNIRALVIDLRGNPGGQIDVLSRIAGMFLGEVEAARLVDKQGKERSIVRSTGKRIVPEVPLAVLVDQGTASAAEIFAALLREQAGAKIFGNQTLGKTLAHKVELLSDKSGLFLTLGELRTGQNASLLNEGLQPDQAIDQYGGPERAIEKAIEVIRRKS